MRALHVAYVIGSRSCTNQCNICISDMTPDMGMGYKRPSVNEKEFKAATNIALNHGPENAMFTAKGATEFYPGQLTQSLAWLTQILYERNYHFDRIELQTDGALLARPKYDEHLDGWRAQGLDTVAISIYHYDPEINKEEFRPKSGKYFDLPGLLGKLHSKDYRTRLSCTLLDTGINSTEEVKKLIKFAEQNNVFQLTLRDPSIPRNCVDTNRSRDVQEYIRKHRLAPDRLEEIVEFIRSEGTFCYPLPFGAEVYEIYGQNLAITTGLTVPKREGEETKATEDEGIRELPEADKPKGDEIRELIVMPVGNEVWVTTSWENPQGGRLR